MARSDYFLTWQLIFAYRFDLNLKLFIAFDRPGLYFQVATVILLVPVILFFLCVLVAINTQMKHKAYRISNYMYTGYYVIGYSFVLLERVIAILWCMVVFQAFVCDSHSTNTVGEYVSTPFEKCWTSEHITYLIFAVFSAACYLTMVTLSCLLFSLSTFNSPLPWVDALVLVRLLVFVQKCVISAFLVFDPQV